MTVPDVTYTVEIAWTSTWRTAAASRVWTDVSDYVELQDGMGIDYGRSDEISTADANGLSLTLDNTDGRFTWGNASSPYYPNVKIGKPIRVTATVGGGDYVRFVGLINEWPVDWQGDSTTYVKAPITASSRLSRLGLKSPLVQTLDETIEATEPAYYWPLAELSGSTEAAERRGRADSLALSSQTVTFGVGSEDEPVEELGIDGRGGVKLTGYGGDGDPGGALSATVSAIDLLVGCSISLFVKVLNPSTSAVYDTLELVTFAPVPPVTVSSNNDLSILLGRIDLTSASLALPTGLAEDGSVHHVVATVQPSGAAHLITAYVDGVEVASGSDNNSLPSDSVGPVVTVRQPGNGADSRNVLVGRLAIWDRALTAAEVTSIYEAGHDAFEGDTADERLERYAEWAHIPAAEVTTTASTVTLAGVQAEGAQVLDLMRQVETAEGGTLYDDRDGNLVLEPRNARYDVDPVLTVALTDDQVSDFRPKVDRQGLANAGKGTNSAGTVEVYYSDETSREDYGDHGYDVETTALSADEPLQLVAWRINGNAEPRPRVPAPTVSVIDWFGTADLPALLALDVGSKVRITDAPAQSPGGGGTSDYFVEGYSESMGVGTWTLSLNLSPVTPYDDVLILDSATDGLLDTNVVAL